MPMRRSGGLGGDCRDPATITSVIPQIVAGATFGFAAAAQPGPFQAYLISRTLSHGWRQSLPAVLAPLLSDAPVAVVTLAVLGSLPRNAEWVLRLGGGAFLLYLAWAAFGNFRRWEAIEVVSVATAARRTLGEAIVVNVLNPNAWLGWSFVLGPLLLRAWRDGLPSAIALLASFYLVLLGTTTGIVLAVAWARELGPRLARSLVAVSAVALLAFAIWQLRAGWLLLSPLIEAP